MLDILAIGDAIVDKVISFDIKDPVMQKILPVKGLFFNASEAEHAYLRKQIPLACYAGGSAANTIRNMGLLGIKTGFLGKVGNDDDGIFFQDSLNQYGVRSYLLKTDYDRTGCSVVIVHEDKDRTQCARPCAANLLMQEEISDDCLKETGSILMEGYMLNRRPELVADVIERACQYGVKVYFTLSDVHCVKNKKELIEKLLDKIDVLFGNEYEFEALNLTSDTFKKTLCVKTCGAKGVEVFNAVTYEKFDVSFVDEIVNTNGAGDAFASGFLAEFQNNKSFKSCVALGHEIATSVLKTELSYLPIGYKR